MREGSSRHITAKLSLLLAVAAVVSLAQALPSDASGYAAKVITLTGQVSVLKDATPWALNIGDLVQARQLILTGPDGQARFQVSDGSTFDVYPNSRVVFRKNPPNWRDLLDVLVGRVKVHIEHLYGPNPNRVQTPTAVISVRGTTFDIAVDEEDEATTVEVEEGLVEVQHALLPRSNPKLLRTGESIKVYRDVPIASNGIDKGAFARRVMRAAVDAINTWEARMPRGGGSIGGAAGGGAAGGGAGSGDTGNKQPPPPPGPSAPPPPPPPAPAPPVPSAPGHFMESDGGPAVSVLVVREPETGLHTRLHKATHAIWTTMLHMLLGPAPGGDVIRAVQQMSAQN